MSSQSFRQLITVNLQYYGIKITKQCSDVNFVKSIRIRGWCGRITVKIGYSCMANIKSIINMHNKEVITESKIETVKSNCINKPDCPLSNQCQITNIKHKAKITSNLRSCQEKNILQNQPRYI